MLKSLFKHYDILQLVLVSGPLLQKICGLSITWVSCEGFVGFVIFLLTY